MAQILDPLPNGQKGTILCCYVNSTNQIQIARITNIENWYFERVVFPGQRLVFESLSQGQLEIHSGMMASSILSDTIPCEQLCISDSGDEEESDWGEVSSNVKELPAEKVTPATMLSVQASAIAYTKVPVLEPLFA